MSSVSFRNSRKRLHSPDFRDSDSEDELPPSKLMKHTENDIPLAISGKIKNILLWISDLPVKDFFKMAMKSGSKLTNKTIILDDEEEKEEERASQKIDKAANLKALIERFDKSHKPFSSNSGSSGWHSERNGSISIGSYPCYDSYKANGSSSRDWNSRYEENDGYFSRQSRPDNLKHPAILSNPQTALQIVLDTETNVPAPEADDIEILSESPSTKQKHVSSHKSLRLSRHTALRHSTPVMHQSKSEVSSVKRLQSPSPQQFTANEVVRLQEKAQYRILLEKYMYDSPYHEPKKQHADVSIEARANQFSNSHFKKEVVKLPTTDFFEKYCKPIGLLAPDYQVMKEESKEEKEKKKEIAEIKIIDDDDDDEEEELKVLKVIMPHKSKVPKFHTRMAKSSDYFSSRWIAELKISLSELTKEQMIIVADQERALEKFRKERMLRRLRVEPLEPVEPEFPELTPEMEEAVDLALLPGPPDDPIRKDNLDYLVRKDIETLGGLNWLNDRVINTYFELIVERSKQDGYPSIHAFNTFFYGKLKQQGYDSIKRWTRKIDLFSFDLVFVPIHLGVHWCLAVIDNRSKKICYYDSMGTGEEQCLDLLHEYIMLEHKNKKGKEIDPSSYITEIMKDIPQQMNGSDCGMFTVKYAEYISRDAEITFNQSHMQYFRRRMVYELLKSQLL